MENWGFLTEKFRTKARKLEIFNTNKISAIVKDEEKVELFKRSHAITKKKP